LSEVSVLVPARGAHDNTWTILIPAGAAGVRYPAARNTYPGQPLPH
jgi:hypothetical protein